MAIPCGSFWQGRLPTKIAEAAAYAEPALSALDERRAAPGQAKSDSSGQRVEGSLPDKIVIRLGWACFLVLFAFLSLSAARQDAPAPQPPPAETKATVSVHTANGVAIPGASLRIVETASGRAWASWTDENGRVDLQGLPAGHYRIEAEQLGFDAASKEFDLAAGSAASIELSLKIATLQAIDDQTPAQLPNLNPSPAASAAPSNPPANGATPPADNAGQPPGTVRQRQRSPGAAAGAGGATGPAGAGPRFGGGPFTGRRGGFQQVTVQNQNGQQGQDLQADSGQEAGGPALNDQGPLGQAASSDAFLINGTVGRGADMTGFAGLPLDYQAQGGGVVFGPGGFAGGAPGGAGGPAFQGGAPPLGGGGPGGGPVFIQRPGGGGRGGPGPRGGPQGLPALFGMQRVLRQRANRVRISFYDEYSNSVFNARPYSLTEANPPKIPTWSERLGGNIGGPLFLPHLYNGRDRTFFFINFDTTWARNAVDQFSTVPTLAERQQPGNFCDRGVQLYTPGPGNLNAPQTFLGCQIPSSMLNSAALGLLQYIPAPNLPGLVDNYHLQTRVPAQQDRLNVRVLQTISPKLNARVMYGFSQSANHSFQFFPDFESNQGTRGQSVTLGLTQNWSSRLLNDSQLIFSRNRVQTLNDFAFQNDVAGALGITGVSTAPIDWGVPQLNFTNFSRAATTVPSLVRNQTMRLVDGVTYMLPKHTLQFGAEVRRIENNTASDPTPEGLFTFNGLITSLLGPGGRPVAGTGFDFADFLLGYPYSTSVRFGSPSTYFRNWGAAAYVTDDWRVHPDFTLQYGLRYEFFTPITELYGHLSNLDVNSALNQVAVIVPGQAAPFSGTLPGSLVRPQYHNVAPRLGIAWRPPIKALQGRHATVIRAGYGMFYNEPIYSQLAGELANQPPWANSQLRFTGNGQFLTLENGFPSSSFATNTIHNTYAVNPDYKVGYAQLWNFSLETTLVTNTTLVLTYTGTKGTDLDLLLAPNRMPPGSLAPTGPLVNASNFIYDTSGANSIYHALQVRLQRRLSHGIMVNATYTYGKSIDDASSIGGGTPIVVQNPADLRAEYGLSSFDIRQQLRVNYFYELPFGDGHRFAQKGLTAALFGNWRFSGNIGAQTGTPYTAQILGTSAANTGGGGVFASRPDQICDPNLPASQRLPLQFFNKACFGPPAGPFGDAARNTIIGPGMFTWNAQFAKTIPFGKDHEHRLELRWEITNFTNTPNLTGLSTVVNSTTYGRVLGASGMRSMNVETRFNF
jgi:trimeric autotransporter adhesin